MLTALLASVMLGNYAPPVPRANLAPNPNYNQLCVDVGSTASACAEATLQALDAAHAHEQIGPLMLPRNWLSLTPAEQIFVITNLERVARGETPITGLTASLNAVAGVGAAEKTDPRVSGVLAPAVSIWAEDAGPLASDYGWMYQDGYGGPGNTPNLACTTAASSGCWGHRDNILAEWSRKLLAGRPGPWYLVAGAAQTVIPAGLGTARAVSDAMIVTAVPTPPTYVYTWAEAVSEGAGRPTGVQAIPGTIDWGKVVSSGIAWIRGHKFPASLIAVIILLLWRRPARHRSRSSKQPGKVHDIRHYRR